MSEPLVLTDTRQVTPERMILGPGRMDNLLKAHI